MDKVAKRALLLLLFSIIPTSAFTSVQRTKATIRPLAFSTSTEESTDVASVYEQLGIEPGKLALGVKPDEVLKYVGTYVA